MGVNADSKYRNPLLEALDHQWRSPGSSPGQSPNLILGLRGTDAGYQGALADLKLCVLLSSRLDQ
jgi:hypothetical protein